MIPTLAVLEKKCKALGLVVKQSGKRPAKADYVQALRAHFLPKDYPAGLPYEEISPMLCFAVWNLKEDEAEAVWASDRWIAEWKENGCRGIFHRVVGVGSFMHSRTVSLKTWRFQELQRQILPEVVTEIEKVFADSVTLDLELIIEKPVDTRPYTAKGEVTKTSLHSTTAVLHLESASAHKLQREQDAPLHFKVLDVVKWKGQDARRTPLRVRLDWREDVMKMVAANPVLAPLFHKPQSTRVAKKAFFDNVVASGGEGVILKNLESLYEATTSRGRAAWVKAKKRIEFDAFVSGFKRGEAGSGWENLVGALEFSVHTERGVHVLGYVTNLTMEDRVAMSEFDGTLVSLKAEMYGKVAEISGQDVSAREMRLSHCTLDRWRTGTGDQKSADECRVSLKDLEVASAWVG